MTSMERFVCPLDVVCSDEQIRSSERRIHPAGIIGANERLDSDLVENSFRD